MSFKLKHGKYESEITRNIRICLSKSRMENRIQFKIKRWKCNTEIRCCIEMSRSKDIKCDAVQNQEELYVIIRGRKM